VPGQEELAMGAIASGGMVVLQSDVIAAFSIQKETIDAWLRASDSKSSAAKPLTATARPPARLDGVP